MFIVQLGDIFGDIGTYISRPWERIGQGFSSGQPLKVLEGLVLGPASLALAPIYGVSKITSTAFGGLPIVGPALKTSTNLFESPGRTFSNLVRGVPQIIAGAGTGFVTGNVPGAIGGAVLAAGSAGQDASKEYRVPFVGSLIKGAGYGIAGGSVANVAIAGSAWWTAAEPTGPSGALVLHQTGSEALYSKEGVVANLPVDISVSTTPSQSMGFFDRLYQQFQAAPIGVIIPDSIGVPGFVSEHPWLTGAGLLAAGGMFGGGSKSQMPIQDQSALITDTGGAVGVAQGPAQSISYPMNYDAGQGTGYWSGPSLPQPQSVPGLIQQQAGLLDNIPLPLIGVVVIAGILFYMNSGKKKRR